VSNIYVFKIYFQTLASSPFCPAPRRLNYWRLLRLVYSRLAAIRKGLFTIQANFSVLPIENSPQRYTFC